MRAFVTIRQSISIKPSDQLAVLQHEMSELKIYLEEIFTDQNDINEDTRLQIELINQSLAELQADNSNSKSPRRKIGYIQHEE